MFRRIPRLATAISTGAFAIGLAAIPVLAASAPTETTGTGSTQPMAFVPYNEAHPILAYYYAWWDAENFGRTLYKPFAAYNSDDTSFMRRHIEEAQSAGIDGFIISWLGTGNRTDQNLARILDMGTQSGFRATVHFETPTFAKYGVSDVVDQLKALYATRLSHPAWVTYQGRPVIFFWRSGTYNNATWSDIRAQVDPDHVAVWIADGDRFDIITGDAWDGISPYAIAWSSNPAAQLPAWGAKAAAADPGKLYIPPVSPGCDDTAARAPTCIQSRADGSYYQATLEGAFASNPAWAVIVSSFNEWMESTQIEPSTAYGDYYLSLTREFANTFKAQEQAFQTVAADPAVTAAEHIPAEEEIGPGEG